MPFGQENLTCNLINNSPLWRSAKKSFFISRRTDGAARGELSLLRLSRVVTEEDDSQIAEIAEQREPKKVYFHLAES